MRGHRLTPRQVYQIRAATGPQKVIAHRFGITQPHVCRIKAGKVRALSYRLTAARAINGSLITLACTGVA